MYAVIRGLTLCQGFGNWEVPQSPDDSLLCYNCLLLTQAVSERVRAQFESLTIEPRLARSFTTQCTHYTRVHTSPMARFAQALVTITWAVIFYVSECPEWLNALTHSCNWLTLLLSAGSPSPATWNIVRSTQLPIKLLIGSRCRWIMQKNTQLNWKCVPN